jgi:lipoate-protein ligase A
MLLILWQCTPSVITGKNQIPFQEVDYSYIKKRKIDLVRRISGGGTVYHDFGNLNFTYILNGSGLYGPDFLFFAGPIFRCLEILGIKAEASGHNDLTIGGQKFSGNARYVYKDRILHHGTILFDSDLSSLEKALTPRTEYCSRAIRSVRNRVTNIREKLRTDMDMATFKNLLIRTIFSYHGAPFLEYRLTGDDLAAVTGLADAKYRTWEWTYGRSPEFRVQKEITFAGRRLLVHLTVEKGIITKCAIPSGGSACEAADTLSRQLSGQRFDRFLTG